MSFPFKAFDRAANDFAPAPDEQPSVIRLVPPREAEVASSSRWMMGSYALIAAAIAFTLWTWRAPLLTAAYETFAQPDEAVAAMEVAPVVHAAVPVAPQMENPAPEAVAAENVPEPPPMTLVENYLPPVASMGISLPATELEAAKPAQTNAAELDQIMAQLGNMPIEPVSAAVMAAPAESVVQVTSARGTSSTTRQLADASKLAQSGHAEAALELYDQLLSKEPDHIAAQNGKAYALQRAGRSAQALALWQQILMQAPANEEALTNYVAALAGDKSASASFYLQDVLKKYPQFAPAHAALSQNQAARGDLGRAIENMQHAWALDRDNPVYRLNLAILWDRNGDQAQALTLYRQLLDQRESVKDSLPMSWEQIRSRATYLAGQTMPATQPATTLTTSTPAPTAKSYGPSFMLDMR